MESLGDKLRTIREDKGFSYDHVSRETNISSRYLQALEKEDFSAFPGESYLLGFLKNYGEFLGLNQEELLPLYRSIKLREQPVPVEELLRKTSPLPKILIGTAIAILILGLAAGVFFLVRRITAKTENPSMAARTASEYVLNAGTLERRFYPGDSFLVTEGNSTYKFILSGISDAITITTPTGAVMLDLGQEVTINLSNDRQEKLRIIAADFVKNDDQAGALLRLEQDAPVQAAAAEVSQMEIQVLEKEADLVLLSSSGAFPFTLQAVFQGYCLFRYEILFERDRQGRNEQYYQRSEELSITAQNGIRLGISNAHAVKLQVVGAGRTIPFEAGSAGEVVAADLRWVRDDADHYRLVLIRLE